MCELRATLWDMDGTTVDSGHAWELAIREAAAACGVEWSQTDQDAVRGHGMGAVAQRFHDQNPEVVVTSVIPMIEEVGARLARESPPQPLPGVQELLEDCRAHDIECALVTMTGQAAAQAILGRLPPDLFSIMITGDDVERPKPWPDPYLRAVARMGLPGGGCLVLEDSPVGFASSLAAGLPTLAITPNTSVPLPSGVARWPTLLGRTADDLRVVHQQLFRPS